MASGTYLLPTRRALFLTIFKSQFRDSPLWYLLETVVVLNASGTELVEALLDVQRVFEDVGADWAQQSFFNAVEKLKIHEIRFVSLIFLVQAFQFLIDHLDDLMRLEAKFLEFIDSFVCMIGILSQLLVWYFL